MKNDFNEAYLKMFSKNANLVLVGFEETKNKLKEARKIVVTGTPTKIRKLNINKTEKQEILNKIGIKNNLPTVLIYGGSQGAQAINQAVKQLIKNYKNEKYQIIWATGPKQYDIIKEEFEKENININYINNVKVIPYKQEIKVNSIKFVAVVFSKALSIKL